MEAFKLQREMVEKGLTSDVLVYRELINGLCKEDRRQESELLLNKMQEKGLLPSGFTIDRPIENFQLSNMHQGAEPAWTSLRNS
jgi:pentatricopeptide repeat protein